MKGATGLRKGGFFRGFVYAGAGILRGIREERNLRFHFAAAAFVIYFSHFYAFSVAQRMLLALVICGVISLELVNSALERVVTNPKTPQRYALAGAVKDMAAGAVLVFCIGAAFCGVLLFFDAAVLQQIIAYFLAAWYRPVLLAVALLAAYLFVFQYDHFDKRRNNI